LRPPELRSTGLGDHPGCDVSRCVAGAGCAADVSTTGPRQLRAASLLGGLRQDLRMINRPDHVVVALVAPDEGQARQRQCRDDPVTGLLGVCLRMCAERITTPDSAARQAPASVLVGAARGTGIGRGSRRHVQRHVHAALGAGKPAYQRNTPDVLTEAAGTAPLPFLYRLLRRRDKPVRRPIGGRRAPRRPASASTIAFDEPRRGEGGAMAGDAPATAPLEAFGR
jgi:hypothetical protein